MRKYGLDRLLQPMDSEDERVAIVACNSILDRAFSKPKVESKQRDSLETMDRVFADVKTVDEMVAMLAGAERAGE